MICTYYPPSVGLVPTDPTTSFKNDDYHADLDAENIYRLILTGKTFVEAANQYYPSLTSTNTRADIFRTYISYTTVCQKVGDYALIFWGFSGDSASMSAIRQSNPDTYNFLVSLEYGLADMGDYA